MTQRKLIVILSFVALVISLIFIGRRLWPSSPGFNPAPFIGLGQTLAEETIKAVGGKGRVVLVLDDQFQIAGSPLQKELQSLQDGLKKQSAVNVETELVGPDPTEMRITQGCTGSQLQAILAKHGSASAIVFLIGLPEWGRLQARGLAPQPVSAKIIVAVESAPSKREYEGYLTGGFLYMLIGRRFGPDSTVNPKTPREWFDQSYRIITLQNFETTLL